MNVVEIKSRKIPGTYAEIRRRFYRIKAMYPFAGCGVCARSRTGRALFTLSLGNTNDCVLCIGCTDGVSEQAVFAMMRIFEDMCRAYSCGEKLCGIRLRDVLDDRGVIFVPCVNPDALEINASGPEAAGSCAGTVRSCFSPGMPWRANAAGIDLNINISPDFKALSALARSIGYTAPGARFYGGTAPLTEPETRGIARLCELYPVRHIMEIGAGNNELYRAGGEYTEKCALIAEILRLSSCCSHVEKSNSPESCHGFADWFSASFRRPAFSLCFGDFADSGYLRLSETVVLSVIM